MNQEQIRSSDAKALLANPVFKAAMNQLEASLEAQALSTDPDNKDKCARIVIAKQLLKGIEREIGRFIEDGQIADLIELEERKKTLFKRVYQR